MVSEDFRYTFYALRRGQFMSEASKATLDRNKEKKIFVKFLIYRCHPVIISDV
jgi:hypothetical protein